MVLTVDEVWDFSPCPDYPYERIVELFNGRETLSLREIADLDIPLGDRMWVLCNAHRDRAFEWSCQVLEDYLLTVIADSPSVAWQSWANAWITGEDRSWDSAHRAGLGYIDLPFIRAVWYAKDIATRAVIWTRPGAVLEQTDLEYMCHE